LADSLKGKQGRFRQNLLGKRIDYSGRSVIVVNPKLRLFECGLPKMMALELFKPFVISQLIKAEVVHNVRSASRYIETGTDLVWDILEKIVKEAYVLLNRAPTLHRLGIQAFKPILIEGKAIQIHPLVCVAFNADFDGDQMAVHVPLTLEAVAEARDLMLSSRNLLKPATGDPVVAPTQDIVWGAFYMTNALPPETDPKKRMMYFSCPDEAKIAYQNNIIKVNENIKVRINKDYAPSYQNSELVDTTVGRIYFNDILPVKLRFVNEVMTKGKLKTITKDCLCFYGEDETVTFLDELKEKSFTFITKSGLSWGMDDLPDFKDKDILIENATVEVEKIQEQYEEGLLTDSERYAKVIELWIGVKDKVTDICKAGLPKDGSAFSMIESGARGSWTQLAQIIGMKGLVTSPSGEIIELPVKGNFKRGFDVLEYFISTHATRKGLSDTALRTANAGYLTRRLVDVSQDVMVITDDCKDKDGYLLTKKESDEMGYDLLKRIVGRYLASDLKNKKGKVLLEAGSLITEAEIVKIKNEEIEEVHLRSVLSCKLSRGTCVKCYGYDLGYNKPVTIGTAAGVIAAQSIGEPGTQLTMRTFHSGGVAGSDDITQGLPRVEEIFEARPPKRKAFIAEVDGRVMIETAEREEGDRATVIAPQSKILKTYYEGTDTDKYYFAEAVKEWQLSQKSGDNKIKGKRKKIEPKILVKDGQKVTVGANLFSIEDRVVIAKAGGTIKVEEKCIKITVAMEKYREYMVTKGTNILVKNGDIVKKGDQLTEGSLDLHQLFHLRGKLEAQKYIIKEIQYVYASQGQPLNDKHIEIIARQMFSRVFVHDIGETDLLPGEIIEKDIYVLANKAAKKNGKKEARGEELLLGISRASLTTDSFLSAASFQETARVLIDAALNGKVDYLKGLKENVIIGRLIPAGTGYREMKKMV
jgi:DNA-directed RNA polymerase subunit beta'